MSKEYALPPYITEPEKTKTKAKSKTIRKPKNKKDTK